MAHHQRGVLVLEALARGIAEYGAPKEILTDQGRQYTAWRGSTEFEAELKRHGIAHVKSRPHHPQTCGKIERFWKTLWEELLSRIVFADFEDCQRRVALFIQHYDFQRPHQGLEGLTPADRYFRAASQVRASIDNNLCTSERRVRWSQDEMCGHGRSRRVRFVLSFMPPLDDMNPCPTSANAPGPGNTSRENVNWGMHAAAFLNKDNHVDVAHSSKRLRYPPSPFAIVSRSAGTKELPHSTVLITQQRVIRGHCPVGVSVLLSNSTFNPILIRARIFSRSAAVAGS